MGFEIATAPPPAGAAGMADVVRLGAAGGAVVLALSSSGDVLLLGVLLALAAGEVAAGAAAVLTGVAVLLRWGSPSLSALAGAQSVLGPAGSVGPEVAALSAWFGAVALVLAAGASGPERTGAGSELAWLRSVAFGLTAAAVVAGPGPGSRLWVRLLASAAAVAVARALSTRATGAPLGWVAVAAAALACVLAAAA